jgi:hypothetical protein
VFVSSSYQDHNFDISNAEESMHSSELLFLHSVTVSQASTIIPICTPQGWCAAPEIAAHTWVPAAATSATAQLLRLATAHPSSYALPVAKCLARGLQATVLEASDARYFTSRVPSVLNRRTNVQHPGVNKHMTQTTSHAMSRLVAASVSQDAGMADAYTPCLHDL